VREGTPHFCQSTSPEACIQYDYFHILQNIRRKLWAYARVHRRAVEARSKKVRTPWYRERLEALAKTLWKKRYLLFKSDERMSPEEQQQLVEIMEADPKVGQLRAFLKGVWHTFRESGTHKKPGKPWRPSSR
jgi:hypothetical protein